MVVTVVTVNRRSHALLSERETAFYSSSSGEPSDCDHVRLAITAEIVRDGASANNLSSESSVGARHSSKHCTLYCTKSNPLLAKR